MPEFRPNPLLEEELRKTPEMRVAILDAATVVKNNATVVAKAVSEPWMPRKRQTIEVRQINSGEDVMVVNTDYGAAITEWGGYHNPPYAPLRIGVWSSGLKWRPSPKDSEHAIIPPG